MIELFSFPFFLAKGLSQCNHILTVAQLLQSTPMHRTIITVLHLTCTDFWFAHYELGFVKRHLPTLRFRHADVTIVWPILKLQERGAMIKHHNTVFWLCYFKEFMNV